MAASTDPQAARLGEVIATLAVASDIALGQPQESELRTCLLALGLADRLGLDDAARADVHYVAQLRFIGCTAHAHEMADMFGDEITFLAKNALVNSGDPADVLLEVIRNAGAGRPLVERLRVLGSALAGGKQFAEMNFRTSCEVAREIVARLDLGDGVRRALWCAFERWDGHGVPNGVAADEIPIEMRVVHLAQDMEALLRHGGTEPAIAVATKRRGKAYDPTVVDAFVSGAADLAATLDVTSIWDAVLAAEPAPHRVLSGEELDEGLRVAADFVDLKSPFTAGHSRGVADLAAAAAEVCGLGAADVVAVRRAGWVHDLGRTAVPNTIWDKPGALTDAEFERVRMHPYFTQRLLARTSAFARLEELASCHHERADGSGYHRSLKTAMLDPAARILAAADVYHAMTEDRAHRVALAPADAAAAVRAEVQAARIDPEAAEAVLVAAGHRRRAGVKAQWPAGLTTREVDVLRLLAQGLTTKQIAARLVISAKTADSHIQHLYTKIGCSTRGAAALFAMQHDLVGDRSPPNR